MKLLIPIGLVAAIAAIALIATGGGSSGAGTTASRPAYGAAQTTTPAAGGDAAATVMTRQTKLGRVLVDGRGRTLYLFEADKPNASTCSGACASIWPLDVTQGSPVAGSGVSAGKLGTIAGPGGKRQITYNGWPLYLYAGDRKAGDTTGQGLDQFGAEWYVLDPSGHKIDED